jgi:hypothetical protein
MNCITNFRLDETAISRPNKPMIYCTPLSLNMRKEEANDKRDAHFSRPCKVKLHTGSGITAECWSQTLEQQRFCTPRSVFVRLQYKHDTSIWPACPSITNHNSAFWAHGPWSCRDATPRFLLFFPSELRRLPKTLWGLCFKPSMTHNVTTLFIIWDLFPILMRNM